MRTIIDVPAHQLSGLDDICTRESISRAEAVRRAVALYLERERGRGAESAFGIWHGRNVDGLQYEQRLRREWDTEPAKRR